MELQRLIIVPPELAYGKKGVQEIPPNATIERPRTPNPHEHSRKISKIQSRPPPPYPETWSSPSCLPSPSPRAAPFHSRAGGRRGGRPSPAAAAAPRTRPPGAPGGGSPLSSPPPQWWELAWPEGKPARCPPAGGRSGLPRFRRASSQPCQMASSTMTSR